MIKQIREIFWKLPKNKQKELKILLLLVLFCASFETLTLWLLMPVIKILTIADGGSLDFEMFSFQEIIVDKNLKVLAILLLGGAYFGKNIFLMYVLWKQKTFAFSCRAELAKVLFKNYLHRSLYFHKKTNSSRLIRNVTGETSIFIGYAIVPMMALASEFATFVLFLILALAISPYLVPIFLSIFCIVGSGFFLISKGMLKGWGEVRQNEDGLVLKFLDEAFSSIKETKLFMREQVLIKKLFNSSSRSGKMLANEQALQGAPRYIVEQTLVFAICLWMLFFVFQFNGFTTSVEVIVLFAAMGFRLVPSVSRVLSFLQSIKFATSAIESVHAGATFEENNTIQKNSHFTSKTQLNQKFSIQLNAISFGFANDKRTLFSDVNLVLNSNNIYGFVGRSGVGKTTLIDLICGLLLPANGSISLNGRTLTVPLFKAIDIAYVGQEPFILDDDIIANVTFSDKLNVDFDRLDKALADANLTEFGNSSIGYSLDNLGEKGSAISGGQKQRITIARALYRNSRFIVLDEFTSSLDGPNEKSILTTIEKLKSGRVVLMITHRKEPLKICDKVLTITNKQIKEI